MSAEPWSTHLAQLLIGLSGSVHCCLPFHVGPQVGRTWGSGSCATTYFCSSCKFPGSLELLLCKLEVTTGHCTTPALLATMQLTSPKCGTQRLGQALLGGMPSGPGEAPLTSGDVHAFPCLHLGLYRSST